MAEDNTLGCWNRIGSTGDATCPNLEEVVHCRNCPVYSQAGRSLLERAAPADYVNEWTALLAERQQAAATDTISLVIFRLSSEWFALRTRILEKIVAVHTIHCIPHRSNALLLGLVNIRGNLLLCISLAHMLGLRDSEPQATGLSPARAARMIVINDGAARWVFPVDQVGGVHHLPAEELEPVPVTVAKAALAYSQGLFTQSEKHVALLDEQLIFSALQRSMRWQVTK